MVILDREEMKRRLLSAAVMLLGIVVVVGFFAVRTLALSPADATCDQSLWTHVYHGKKFATAQDRLKPIDECKTVTGTLHFVRYEADGDAHLRLDVDPEFKNLLNPKNAAEKNMLVVEFMCEKTPTQTDTVDEGVCKTWQQLIYKASMNGQHVSVTGAYVEDEEHGWREIHPVTSIVVTPAQ
jgi:hypothetical protein